MSPTIALEVDSMRKSTVSAKEQLLAHLEKLVATPG